MRVILYDIFQLKQQLERLSAFLEGDSPHWH